MSWMLDIDDMTDEKLMAMSKDELMEIYQEISHNIMTSDRVEFISRLVEIIKKKDKKVLLRFHWSPDQGDETCICSACRKTIDIEDSMIRMFEQEGKFELRFHETCYRDIFGDFLAPNLSDFTYEWGDKEVLDDV